MSPSAALARPARVLMLVAVLVALLVGPLGIDAVRAAPPGGLVPAAGAHFGAHTSDVAGLERKLGRRLAVVNRYHDFTHRDYGKERAVLAAGKIPLISWRGTEKGRDPRRAAKIASGAYDGVIRSTADAVKALRRPVLVRWHWEMDQKPGMRQYIGEPAQYIAAWRRIRTIFRAKGVSNAHFVWAPTAGSFYGSRGPAYFPGSQYVDWIGGSAVPTSQFADFRQMYGRFYAWAASKGKPLLIWSGVRERPGAPGWKRQWFVGARSVMKSAMPRVKAFVYYHARSPKGFSYQADTTSGAFAAFRDLACDPHFRPLTRC